MHYKRLYNQQTNGVICQGTDMEGCLSGVRVVSTATAVSGCTAPRSLLLNSSHYNLAYLFSPKLLTKFVCADSHLLGPVVRILSLPSLPSLSTLWKAFVPASSLMKPGPTGAFLASRKARTLMFRAALRGLTAKGGAGVAAAVLSMLSMLAGPQRFGRGPFVFRRFLSRTGTYSPANSFCWSATPPRGTHKRTPVQQVVLNRARSRPRSKKFAV